MRTAALAVALAAFTAACGDPEEGERCTTAHCSSDDTAAFFCDDGIYRRVECKGPTHCTERKEPGVIIFMCDISDNVAGDHCPFSYNGFVGCRDGGKSALVCTQGFMKERECKTTCEPGTSSSQPGKCE